MKKSLRREWHKSVAEKLMEWGNWVFAGTVLAQIFADRDINIPALIGGISTFIGAYYLARLLMVGGEK